MIKEKIFRKPIIEIIMIVYDVQNFYLYITPHILSCLGIIDLNLKVGKEPIYFYFTHENTKA